MRGEVVGDVMGRVISPPREIGQRVSLTFSRLLKTIYFYAKTVVGVTTKRRVYCKKPRKNAGFDSLTGLQRALTDLQCIRRANGFRMKIAIFSEVAIAAECASRPRCWDTIFRVNRSGCRSVNIRLRSYEL